MRARKRTGNGRGRVERERGFVGRVVGALTPAKAFGGLCFVTILRFPIMQLGHIAAATGQILVPSAARAFDLIFLATRELIL